MRFRVLVGLLAGCSSLVGQPLSAADDIALEASSAWEMDYAEDSCALRRLFGEPGQKTLLELRRFSPASRMQVSVTSEIDRSIVSPLKYRFGADGAWQSTRDRLQLDLGDAYRGYTFGGSILPEPADEARLAQAFGEASSFSTTGGFRRSMTLKTGSMLAPHRAMEKCLDELLTHWGVNAEAHKSLTRAATPVSASRLAQKVAYPTRMLTEFPPGLMHVRLGISEAGTVTACRIHLGISHPSFERSTCSDLKAMRFEPALDRNGRPIASYWVTSTAYNMD